MINRCGILQYHCRILLSIVIVLSFYHSGFKTERRLQSPVKLTDRPRRDQDHQDSINRKSKLPTVSIWSSGKENTRMSCKLIYSRNKGLLFRRDVI